MVDQLTSAQILFAIATGFVPSFIWLIFWMKRGRGHNEPRGLITLCFIMGAGMVFFAGVFEKGAQKLIASSTAQIIVWVAVEEVLKFVAAYLIAFRDGYKNDAIDPAMYMMAAALGFAALENVLYVLHPSGEFSIITSLLTGGLRFFGSTLLHSIASGFVGIVIGLTPRGYKYMGVLLGLGGAVFLHSTFNFFILRNDTASFLQIYGYLWVAAIISFMILEKLRRIPVPTPAHLSMTTSTL